MFARNAVRLLALLILCLTVIVPSWAQDAVESESVREASVETKPELPKLDLVPLEVTLDPTITVTLEGEATAATVHVTKDGEHYLDAGPILEALDDTVVFDETESVLMVTRSQDGVTMSLYTDTGLVQADGKDLGRLETYGQVTSNQLLLTSNAIAVLSGAKGKYSKKTGSYSFELDPRLKVATGFDISVEGQNLLSVSPEPRAVGPVLLLPLLPIAEALGSDMQVVDNGNAVRVRRAQDSAVFEMDLSSGLIKLNGNPKGVARNVTYIDPVNLLLPSSAVEALTGTHVNVQGQSTLIEITLDERLGNSVRPGEYVDEAVADTPFTPESLTFSIGPDQVNTVTSDFHYKGYNGRLRYEAQDLPSSIAELEPSWLSLDFAHVDGTIGSLGDISADRRETQSVGINRLRGLKFEEYRDNGRWNLVMGVPNNGTRRISDDQTRLDFGGFAAGVRHANVEGWEAGLAVSHSNLTKDQRLVLSAISNRLDLTKKADSPLANVDVAASADLGFFNGPARERAVDVRASFAANYDVTESVRVDAFASYDGVEFLRSDLDREDEEDRITAALARGELVEDDETFVPDTRRRGSDRMDYGLSVRTSLQDKGVLRRPTVTLRAEQSRVGVTTSANRSTLSRVTAAAGTTLGDTGVSLSTDATLFDVASERSDSGYSVGARAYRRFDGMTLSADYRISDSDLGRRMSIGTAQLALEPYDLRLPRGAVASIGPVAGANVVNGRWSGQGGVTANLSSGALFGEQNQVTASLGMIQSVSTRGTPRTTRYLSLDYDRTLPIGKNMSLGIGARSNLDGDIRVGLQLKGRYDFNEARRYRRPEEEKGVLSGIAFLDSNRDGIRQEEEQGLPGVMIRLHGTPYALRAGAGGSYTIQNLPQGIYDVRIEGDSLPLGYAQSQDTPNRASISEGRITRLELPVVPRGQLRGSVYEDENGNGAYDRGEARPEGERITIEVDGKTVASVTSTFGQFAFDDLPAAVYTIRQGDTVLLEVDLNQHPDLLAKVKVALPAREPDDPDGPNTKGERASPELAP